MKTKAKNKAPRVQPPKKLNPFEVHINRSKHQVLGRKLKSDHGLPGISKNKALQKRKRSLLQEYKMKDKLNFFIDQRIGEKNSSMTEEDRTMARFAAERMRAFNKKQMFNLSESEVLTHKGQTLSEIEKFEDVRSDDDDDGESNPHRSGHLKGKFVENAHFGGGMLTKSNRDRESLIDQLISESKKRKAERQRNKEETLEATEQLDEDWKAIGNIITSNKKEDAEPKEKQKSDEYDLVMRQLKFEPQAKASQRVKTDEEIAKEEKEELERLENERLKQLREREQWQGAGQHRSADDLDEGFQYHTGGVKEVDLDEASEGSESDSGNEVDKDVKKDEDGSVADGEGDGSEYEEAEDRSEAEEAIEDESEDEGSEEENAMDDLSELMPAVSQVCDEQKKSEEKGGPTPRQDLQTTSAQLTGTELDLPFVIDVPENAEELAALLIGRPAGHVEIIFNRILLNNHPIHNPANKKKILTLCEHLLELIRSGNCRESLVLGGEWSLLSRWNAADCLLHLIEFMAEDSECVQVALMGASWWPAATRPTFGQLAAHLLSPCGPRPQLPLSLRLLCCYAVLQDAKRTCVLYPEVIFCLTSCLNSVSELCSPTAFSTSSQYNIEDEFKILLTNLGEERQPNEEQMLYVTSVLLADFVNIYKIYPHSSILFKSVSESVTLIKVDNLPQKLKGAVLELKEALSAFEEVKLAPLAKAAQKPKALRMYEPSFGVVREGDRGSRRLPPDTLAHQKLVRRHRHETKGALRELRRDRRFLASVKLRQTAQSDEQRMKKVKEIFGSAASQQGELRKLKRKK